VKTLQSYNYEMVDNSEEMIEEKYGDLINNDPQTRTFCKFVAATTNCASLDLKARLTEIPKLVATLQNLFDELKKETAEFAEIAGEVQEIFQGYIKMVMDTQDGAAKVLPYIEQSKTQVGILKDILNLESENPLTSIDKEEIELAVNTMVNVTKEMEDLANRKKKSSNFQSRLELELEH